ncbi:GGDEF domain-containing protein [Parafrankia sp. EUN1f]|uniref:GGDEF domain-containing protein n=1 Tax=Parafrankia sp. EUN1f TaxID=102897 RepID=UPI0001C4421F|nr:GGDEF domain-containing protein [Parafrankia sp. EUN1f]EFC85775.1 diguanylate cyclase [Parafrankia sp. EUN1f]
MKIDALLAAGGAAGRAIAAKSDWESTALGPPGGWGTSLCTALFMCLESRFPMIVMWGSELAYIYNDACIPDLGDKHPDAMGRPFKSLWPEAWDEVGPLSAQVMSGGGSTWSVNKRLLIKRRGYLAETYFTFSFSPIRNISDYGRIAGLLSTYQETTQEVIRARRLACQRELTASLAGLRTQRSVGTHATAVLEKYPADIPFSVVFLWERYPLLSAPQSVTTGGLGGRQARRSFLAELHRCGVLPDIVDAVSTGRGRVIQQLPGWDSIRLAGGSPAPTTAVAVALRNRESSAPIGLFIAGVSDLIALDEDYRDFVEAIAGQISFGLMLARTREAERDRAASARHSSLHDALTGLPNRTSFLKNVGRALLQSQRGGGAVAVLFIDLDGFKAVNDTLGHRAGDDLLCEVASRLRRTTRPGDVVARFAGDEFAVLCVDVASIGSVEQIAGRAAEALALARSGGASAVTASVGVALSGPELLDPEDLLHAADIAMYAAKRQGGGRFLLYDDSMSS